MGRGGALGIQQTLDGLASARCGLAAARTGQPTAPPAGEVANRKAWYRPELCSRAVLDLYRRPLRVEGWDAALLAASVSAEGLTRRSVARDLGALLHAPALVATGAHDR